MTIFLMIAKELLIAKLTEGRNNSVSADNSLANSVAKTFGWGRDTKISTQKQSCVDEYITQLREMTDSESDDATSAALSKLIGECEKTARAVKPAKFDEGYIGLALGECHTIIRRLTNALTDAKLTDTPYDDDPFNKFRYEMARYVWKTVVESSALAEEKKQAVLDNIAACAETLEGLDKTNQERYAFNRKRTVLSSIRELRRRNAELCESKALAVDIPLQLSIFATVSFDTDVLVPGLGELEKYAFSAIKSINGEDMASTSEHTHTESTSSSL
jgi:hypothetical protein